MILKDRIAQQVADGTVTRVYRRWSTARIREEATFISTVGEIRVTRVEVVDFSALVDDDAVKAGYETLGDLAETFRGDEAFPIYRIDLEWVGEDPRVLLANQSALSPSDLNEVRTRLQRFDRASSHGAWKEETLRAIAASPGKRAEELRGRLPKDVFKRNVQKLKALGLTNSLPVGYELTPRGRTVTDAL